MREQGRHRGPGRTPGRSAGRCSRPGTVRLDQSVLPSERVQLWRSRTVGVEVLLYIAGIGAYLFSLRRMASGFLACS
jgi:hypothetical protein